MKNFLVLLLCLSTLLACNNPENKKTEAVQPTEDSDHSNEAPALALNNGARWKSDENTNRNESALEAIVNRLNEKKTKALAYYIAAANELQAGLDKMISECLMQGPDHEALHQWLEPLLEKVDNLKKATNEKRASKLFRGINDRLKSYHQYFE